MSLYCYSGSNRDGASSARHSPAQGSSGESPHREVDREMEGNSANSAGAKGVGSEEEWTGSRFGLRHATSGGDRRQLALYWRHALPS